MKTGRSIPLILVCVVLSGLTSPKAGAQTQASVLSVSDIVSSADSIVVVTLRSEADIKADIKMAATRKEESEARRALLTTRQSKVTLLIREQEGTIESAERRLEEAEEADVEADVKAAEKEYKAAETVLELLELQRDIAEAELRLSTAEVKLCSATLEALELEELLAAQRRKQMQAAGKSQEGDEISLVTAEIHTTEGNLLKALRVCAESRSELADAESDLVDTRNDLHEKRGELLGLGLRHEESSWD